MSVNFLECLLSVESKQYCVFSRFFEARSRKTIPHDLLTGKACEEEYSCAVALGPQIKCKREYGQVTHIPRNDENLGFHTARMRDGCPAT